MHPKTLLFLVKNFCAQTTNCLEFHLVQSSHQIFKSLLVILFVDTFSFTIGSLLSIINFYTNLQSNPQIYFYCTVAIGVFVNLCAASNGFVLFALKYSILHSNKYKIFHFYNYSSDYQNEFLKYGGCLIRQLKRIL